MAQDRVQANFESRLRGSEVFYIPIIVWPPAVCYNRYFYVMDGTPPERLQPYDLDNLRRYEPPILLQSDLNLFSPPFIPSVDASLPHIEHLTGDLASISSQRSSPELRRVASAFQDRTQSSDFDILNFMLTKQDIESIPKDTMGLIDLLCLNLKSHEWRSVARELGVDEAIIITTEYDIFENEREQMKYVFCAWEKLNKSSSHQSKHIQVRRALLKLKIIHFF